MFSKQRLASSLSPPIWGHGEIENLSLTHDRKRDTRVQHLILVDIDGHVRGNGNKLFFLHSLTAT